jgi:ribonuclease Z
MRRFFFWVIGVGAVLALLVVVGLRIPAVQDRLVRAVLDRAVATRPEYLFHDDALRVLFCGTASPLPSETRARACVAVFAAGSFWVVDTGPGSMNRLGLLRVDASRVGGVLLTHFHSDHIGDLGELNMQTWVQGRPAALDVYGPPGVERVVAGFADAYALDTQYRIAHHGADFLPEERSRMTPHPISGPADGAGPTVVYEQDGLKITAFAVDHSPIRPAYGYRFDYGGRSVVVSGDTVKSASLIAAARGADVLIHEAQANHLVALIGEAAAGAGRDRVAKLMGDIPSYHTSPVQAAEAANEAGVQLLVMYHLTPPPPTWVVEQVFVRGVSDVRPSGWLLADDGMLLVLPVGSTEIEIEAL